MKTLPRSKSRCGIAYHESGAGRPLVFLHGVGLCADVWLPQIEAFNPFYRVVAPDLPGHGKSSRLTDATPTVAHYTDQLAEFLQEAVDQPAVIVGHSLGALISIDLASRYASLCKGIAALTPIFRRSPTAQLAVRQRAGELRFDKLNGAVEAPIKRWFGDTQNARNQELAQSCRNWLTQVDRQGYAQAYFAFAHSDGPDEQTLGALHLPTLFLSAEQDRNSTPKMSQSLAAKVADANVVMVSNARHMVPLTHPDEVNAALTQLIERCGFASILSQAIATGAQQ